MIKRRNFRRAICVRGGGPGHRIPVLGRDCSGVAGAAQFRRRRLLRGSLASNMEHKAGACRAAGKKGAGKPAPEPKMHPIDEVPAWRMIGAAVLLAYFLGGWGGYLGGISGNVVRGGSGNMRIDQAEKTRILWLIEKEISELGKNYKAMRSMVRKNWEAILRNQQALEEIRWELDRRNGTLTIPNCVDSKGEGTNREAILRNQQALEEIRWELGSRNGTLTIPNCVDSKGEGTDE
jgi:hypothetical protein